MNKELEQDQIFKDIFSQFLNTDHKNKDDMDAEPVNMIDYYFEKSKEYEKYNKKKTEAEQNF